MNKLTQLQSQFTYLKEKNKFNKFSISVKINKKIEREMEQLEKLEAFYQEKTGKKLYKKDNNFFYTIELSNLFKNFTFSNPDGENIEPTHIPFDSIVDVYFEFIETKTGAVFPCLSGVNVVEYNFSNASDSQPSSVVKTENRETIKQDLEKEVVNPIPANFDGSSGITNLPNHLNSEEDLDKAIAYLENINIVSNPYKSKVVEDLRMKNTITSMVFPDILLSNGVDDLPEKMMKEVFIKGDDVEKMFFINSKGEKVFLFLSMNGYARKIGSKYVFKLIKKHCERLLRLQDIIKKECSEYEKSLRENKLYKTKRQIEIEKNNNVDDRFIVNSKDERFIFNRFKNTDEEVILEENGRVIKEVEKDEYVLSTEESDLINEQITEDYNETIDHIKYLQYQINHSLSDTDFNYNQIIHNLTIDDLPAFDMA